MRRTLEVRHVREGATVGRLIAGSVLVMALLAAACASDPTVSVPPSSDQGDQAAAALDGIPPAALPGQPAAPVEVDAGTLAEDAVDVHGLEALLQEAGFVGGTQRQFSRTGAGRRRIVARVLTFETAGGASRYLAWLNDHVADVIGKAAPNPELHAPADGTVFEHHPNPCCHSETRIFLAAWLRGRTVVTLQVDGPAARASAVPQLLSQLDAAV
jgi:hypothetical protein